jgi:hypothetical protein
MDNERKPLNHSPRDADKKTSGMWVDLLGSDGASRQKVRVQDIIQYGETDIEKGGRRLANVQIRGLYPHVTGNTFEEIDEKVAVAEHKLRITMEHAALASVMAQHARESWRNDKIEAAKREGAGQDKKE